MTTPAAHRETSAAALETALPDISRLRTFVGLDGFVDEIAHIVDKRHDANSYVFIHISVVFGVAVLVTGSIWAKASWGYWWVWDEPTLVSFLIVFLLYCTYYPFRYAIEDRDRQARYASVFAITAGAFVPLNFMAVRMAERCRACAGRSTTTAAAAVRWAAG